MHGNGFCREKWDSQQGSAVCACVGLAQREAWCSDGNPRSRAHAQAKLGAHIQELKLSEVFEQLPNGRETLEQLNWVHHGELAAQIPPPSGPGEGGLGKGRSGKQCLGL